MLTIIMAYKDKELGRQKAREQWHANKAWHSVRRKASYAQNRQTILDQRRIYREQNRDHYNSLQREWREENREHMSLWKKQYNRNPEVRKKKYEANRNYYYRKKAAIFEPLFERQHGKCNGCQRQIPAEFRYDILEFDHILPQSLGGKTTPDNLQLLCRRCNAQKGNKMHWKPSDSREAATKS